MNPETASLVLVVDDDPDVLHSVCAVLESAGYRTLTAGNGREGIAQLEARPDLVLTDMNMDGSSGAELINAIRFGGAGTPVIAMSGWLPAGYDPLAVALKLGATQVLRKDKMDQLLTMVAQVLGART
jgi:CheY-like chemotaxis protein